MNVAGFCFDTGDSENLWTADFSSSSNSFIAHHVKNAYLKLSNYPHLGTEGRKEIQTSDVDQPALYA